MAETVRTLLIHAKEGSISAKYGLISVEATALAVMERLAAGLIRADFRPPDLGLFGIDVGFWDLDCSMQVFDRGRLEECDAATIHMQMPDGTVKLMPLPADLLLWSASVLAAFEYGVQPAAEPVILATTSAENEDSSAANASISSVKNPNPHSAPMPNRKRGNSYRDKDLPLVREMRQLIDARRATGLMDAARAVCGRAIGKGDDASKAKRLIIAYQLEYPDQ